MEYNTERPIMTIPEYGRNIHKMVYHAVTIKDKKLRNKCALSIIKVMGYLYPHLRNIPDFQHKLWDQLFIMSNFRLNVDSEFKKLKKKDFNLPPKKMSYPDKLTEFRYYGRIIKDMIQFAITCKDIVKRRELIYIIANTMKKNYLKWNKNTVDDHVIIKDLEFLSNNKLTLNINELPLISIENIYLTNKKKNKNYHYYKRKRY
jgi:hypothetical protein